MDQYLKLISPTGNDEKLYVLYSNCLPELTYPESEYEIYVKFCNERGFDPTDYDQWVANRVDSDIRVLLDEMDNKVHYDDHVIAILSKNGDYKNGDVILLPFADGNTATALATATGGFMDTMHDPEFIDMVVYHDNEELLAMVADGDKPDEVNYAVWLRKLNEGVDGDEICQKYADGDINLDGILSYSTSVLPDVLKIFEK